LKQANVIKQKQKETKAA